MNKLAGVILPPIPSPSCCMWGQHSVFASHYHHGCFCIRNNDTNVCSIGGKTQRFRTPTTAQNCICNAHHVTSTNGIPNAGQETILGNGSASLGRIG